MLSRDGVRHRAWLAAAAMVALIAAALLVRAPGAGAIAGAIHCPEPGLLKYPQNPRTAIATAKKYTVRAGGFDQHRL